MRKKWTRFLSMSLSLAMILSNNIMPVATYADTNDNESETVIYADDMAYDKTTGHLYKLSSVGTYEQVNAEAKESGGYLACISSAEENEIVAKVASVERASASSYIGLARNEENLQEWLWADGSEVSYTNWQPGEPNSINETVAEIYDNRRNTGAGKWNDCSITLNSTGVIEYNSCIHPESQYVIKNKTLADCEQGGYTGDTYCGFCDEKIADGEDVESGGHADTIIDKKTVKEATCTEEGYTGDKICPTCDKVLEQGKSTPANGHTDSEELRNVKEATCYLDGYTGETYCTVCGETTEVGDAITKLEHDYVDDVCKNCGRINNAQLDTTYTSKITNLYPFQVIQFKAPENGKYKFYCENLSTWDSYGYLFKEDKYSDEVISDGVEKFNEKVENSNAANPRLDNNWYFNDDSGENNAPAITAELEKDKTYYFVVGPYSTATGEFSITITCTHDKTHIEGKTFSDCTVGGYTGDIICDTCGKVVEEGQTVEPGEHQEAVLDEESVVEATCQQKGFTGNMICPKCRTIITAGEEIPLADHVEELVDVSEANCYVMGYTGDTYCNICEEKLAEGTVIPKLEHEYENDICKNCGRIRNAKKGITYSSQTTEGLPIQVIEYTAIENEKILFGCENTEDWDSYGFLFDETNYSDEMVAEALENYYSGEKDKIRFKDYLEKDDDSGVENAPAIKYTVQKDKKYYLVIVPYSNEFGKFTVTIGCPHNKTHLENKTIKSCVEGGYTGDIICNICGKVVEQGENIAPNSEHDYKTIKFVEPTCNEYAKYYLRCRKCGDEQVQVDEQRGYAEHEYVLVNSKKATCTTDGYLGDSKCRYCGLENEEQPEDKVIKAYHDRELGTEDSYMIENYNQIEPSCEKEGYTGDVYCPICHEIIEKGEPIKKLNHSFKDGKCINCDADEEVVNSEKDGYYEISTFNELITYLKNSSSGISGKLMNDIEFPESYEDKEGIVGNEEIVNAVFDGNGHKISGINSKGIKRPLFYGIFRSEIKNLEIEYRNEKYDTNACCDLAIVTTYSNFTNCSVSGNKNVKDSYTSMIMYARNSNFIECTNNANIIFDGNTEMVAGIVCRAENCIFDRCINNGNITTLKVNCTSGIVAKVRNCIIKDCINKGNISSEYDAAAGIVATVDNESNDPWTTSITGCTNEGKIEDAQSDNYNNIAGICAVYQGPNSKADIGELIINDCINNGEITGESAAGIINISNGNLKISNCENNGTITGIEYAGGIVEDISNKDNNEVEINNCTNNGNVFGAEEAAGIIGYAVDIVVNNCTNNGNISSNGGAGGIFAYTRFVKGTGLVNNGNISCMEYVGGIGAYDAGNSTFNKLYNTGIIDEENMAAEVANLVKLGENSTIEDSEEQHVHEFNTETAVVKATTENNGYFEYVCKCGNTNKKEISKINSVSLSAEKYSYTGNSITLPTVTVKDADDKTISSEYYTVAYRNKATGAVVTEIKDEGTYEAVVTFNTLYDGEVVKEFTIVKESVNPNPSDNNGTTTPGGSNTNISNGTDNATTSDKGNDAKITKPAKVTGVSAKVNKKKSITIKWKKQKEAKGYQVRYALNKKMKKAKIKAIKNIKKAYVLKKAKAGKYYIQVRAYTVVNGKKVFGKWSSKKVVKVSK